MFASVLFDCDVAFECCACERLVAWLKGRVLGVIGEIGIGGINGEVGVEGEVNKDRGRVLEGVSGEIGMCGIDLGGVNKEFASLEWEAEEEDNASEIEGFGSPLEEEEEEGDEEEEEDFLRGLLKGELSLCEGVVTCLLLAILLRLLGSSF